jgi:hypothetical protein
MTTQFTEFELTNQHTSIVFEFQLSYHYDKKRSHSWSINKKPIDNDEYCLMIYISNYKLNTIFTQFLKTIFNSVKIENDTKNRYDIFITLSPLEFIYYSEKLRQLNYQDLQAHKKYNEDEIYSKYFKNTKYINIVNDLKKVFDQSNKNEMIEYLDKRLEQNNNLIKIPLFKQAIPKELLNKYDYLINAVNFDLF